jgi:hypothetical protein
MGRNRIQLVGVCHDAKKPLHKRKTRSPASKDCSLDVVWRSHRMGRSVSRTPRCSGTKVENLIANFLLESSFSLYRLLKGWVTVTRRLQAMGRHSWIRQLCTGGDSTAVQRPAVAVVLHLQQLVAAVLHRHRGVSGAS